MNNMITINLTQHMATPEQKADGVVDIANPTERTILLECLHFDEIPDTTELSRRAEALADIGLHGDAAMIGGAPYLMAPLERELLKRGVPPLYAFSKRESMEEVQPDGSVKKTLVFRHLGFVRV